MIRRPLSSPLLPCTTLFRSSFAPKAPPAARMLLKAAGVEKGSGEPHKTKVASVTRDQVREIAQTKMADLNANSLDRSEEHTSELQSRQYLVCRLLLEKKKPTTYTTSI